MTNIFVELNDCEQDRKPPLIIQAVLKTCLVLRHKRILTSWPDTYGVNEIQPFIVNSADDVKGLFVNLIWLTPTLQYIKKNRSSIL